MENKHINKIIFLGFLTVLVITVGCFFWLYYTVLNTQISATPAKDKYKIDETKLNSLSNTKIFDSSALNTRGPGFGRENPFAKY